MLLASILQLLKKPRRRFHRFGLRRIGIPITMSDTEKKVQPHQRPPSDSNDKRTSSGEKYEDLQWKNGPEKQWPEP